MIVRARELAFLLVGLGVGLMFAVAAIVEVMTWWWHHMFIIGFHWGPGLIVLALPFLLIALGSILIYRTRSNP